MNYPAYQFNVLRMIIFSRKFNVYFALSKDYALKVSKQKKKSAVLLLMKNLDLLSERDLQI